jgi:hypothetical protein
MKKSSLKTTIIPFLGTLLLCIIATLASAQTVNFTGTWKLDVEKTKAPGVAPSSISQILKVNQDNKSITINKIAKEGQGEMSGYIETLRFDGTATETTTPSKLTRTSTIKWLADQKSFTESYTAKDDQGVTKQTSTQTWTQSSDGKTLTLTIDLEVGERKFHMEEVYDKQ